MLTAAERGQKKKECRDQRAELSFKLPQLYFHRQWGQSHNLIYSSVNNMESSETILMSEYIKMKLKTENKNTRKERI